MSLSLSLLSRGLLAIAIGIISVAWPDVTVDAFVILFAVYAFLNAAMDTMAAFDSDRAGPVLGYLLLGALSLAGGVVALVWPGITALVLVLWVAAWAVVTGILTAALALRGRDTAGDRAMWAISGLISIALGLVLFIRPDIGALSLATVFGLFSIIHGTAALVLYFQVRNIDTARPLANPTAG
jgi:uncharacterized membrane protein HdeD (DUF308 family)